VAARHAIVPDWPWAQRFGIAQAVRVGSTVYVAGQVAYQPDGTIVGKGDMRAQARQVFENIRGVLEAAGARLEDVVKITAFLTDFSKIDEYIAVRREYLKPGTYAGTGVEVSRLVHPDLLIEVEAVAAVPSTRGAI
jgi:reactive intermediate/imine deaminase